MRLCRRNNPNTYFTTIDKAFIPTHQARELLKVAHNGIEPCDLMYNIIVSAFDLNDDGIIEWCTFQIYNMLFSNCFIIIVAILTLLFLLFFTFYYFYRGISRRFAVRSKNVWSNGKKTRTKTNRCYGYQRNETKIYD